MPEIVVEEALTPPGSTPTSPHRDDSCTASRSHNFTLNKDHVQRSSSVPSSSSHGKALFPKYSSVPPLSSLGPTSLDYEQLSSCPVSCSSSRSESPLSERYFEKCSSLLSLNYNARLTDSDGVFDYNTEATAKAQGSSSPSKGTKVTRTKRRRRRSRSKRNSPSSPSSRTSVSGEGATGPAPLIVQPDQLLATDFGLAEVCSPRKSLMKKRLRTHQQHAAKLEMPTSSSNESVHSSK